MRYVSEIRSLAAESDRSFRIAIVGGPATGKTSVVNLLKKVFEDAQGVMVAGEAARKIISEGDILPWVDLIGFQNEVLSRSIDMYEQADSVTFFDRAIADGVVYCEAFGNEVPENLSVAASKYTYDFVFYFPFWPEIFENDEERSETIDEAKRLDDVTRKVYLENKRSGPCFAVPIGVSVEARVEFILSKVIENTYFRFAI